MQLTVSPLPALGKDDELLCLFGDSPPHSAGVEGDTVTCDSPSSIPGTPPGQGEAPPSSRRLPSLLLPLRGGVVSPPVTPLRRAC